MILGYEWSFLLLAHDVFCISCVSGGFLPNVFSCVDSRLSVDRFPGVRATQLPGTSTWLQKNDFLIFFGTGTYCAMIWKQYGNV